MSTGPTATWPANTTERLRRRWSGASSSRPMARAASAATIPPWGTTTSIHTSLISAVNRPGWPATGVISRSSQPVVPTAGEPT